MRKVLVVLLVFGVFAVVGLGCLHGEDEGDDDTADDDVSDDDIDDDTEPELESITVEPPYAGVPVGSTQRFRALGRFSDDSTQYLTDVQWSTSDESLATINADGLLSSVADGIVEVIAEKDGVSGTATAYLKPDVLVLDSFGAGIAAIDRVSGDVVEFVVAGGTGTTPNKIYVHDGKVFVVDSGDGTNNGYLRYISLQDMYAAKAEPAELELTDCVNPWDLAFVDDYIYVTCLLSDRVVKVSLASKGVVAGIDLPEGSAPQDIIYGAGRLIVAATYYDFDTYTANLGSVVFIDPSTDTVEDEIFTGDYNPTELALNADETKLYVSNTDWHDLSGSITVIELGSDVVSNIEVGTAPGPLALAQNGRLFVGEQAAGSVYVIDTSDDSVLVGADDPIAIPGAWWVHGLGYIPDADAVYALDFSGYIYSIDPDDYELSDPFAFDSTSPQDLASF